MFGRRPAGELLPPSLVSTCSIAVPVLWAGYQHSKMADTDACWSAHVTFSGPALNSSSTTGAPLPG